MDVSEEILRRQIMIGQFCNQVGCSTEQATKILQAARWQIEVRENVTVCGLDRNVAIWNGRML